MSQETAPVETVETEEKKSPRIALRDEVLNILSAHNVSKKAIEAVKELMTPKKGAVLNLDEVTKRDHNSGAITEIKCSLSGVFLPATEEYFYKKEGTTLGFDRNSKQATKIKLDHSKAISATEKNVFTDLMAGTITPEQARTIVDEAKAKEVDYSSVGLIPATTAE